MNLEVTLSIYGGGPGSGCQGPNCGRKKTKSDVSITGSGWYAKDGRWFPYTTEDQEGVGHGETAVAHGLASPVYRGPDLDPEATMEKAFDAGHVRVREFRGMFLVEGTDLDSLENAVIRLRLGSKDTVEVNQYGKAAMPGMFRSEYGKGTAYSKDDALDWIAKRKRVA